MSRDNTFARERVLNTLPEYQISGTILSPFNAEDLEKRALVRIRRSEVGADNGMNDERLGVYTKDSCATCQQDYLGCVGHEGIVKLSTPIIHPLFLKNVISTLKCVCLSCGELLLSDEAIEAVKAKGYDRLNKLAIASTRMMCKAVHGPEFKPCVRNPEFSMTTNKDSHILKCDYDFKDGKQNSVLVIENIIEILKSISDNPQTLKKLGFIGKTKPIDYIMMNFYIIPPCCRPLIAQGGEIRQNSIVSAYKQLITINEALREDSDLSETRRLELTRELYNIIIHIMDNSDGTLKYGKEVVMSLKGLLAKKNGLFRGLLTKRDNFSGRTVAAPTDHKDIEYIILPKSFKSKLTIEVSVNVYNLDFINKLYDDEEIHSVKFGSGMKKGYKFIITDRNRDTLPAITIGDVVRRYLQDGDFVIVGRQPTLTKFSMVSVKAKFEETSTIKLIGPLTKGFNVDFDGDEVHINVPQSIGTRVESENVMSVGKCVMGFKYPMPNIGILYNGIASAYLLKKTNFKIRSSHWDWLIRMTNKPIHETFVKRLHIGNINFNTTEAMFSHMLPHDFCYRRSDVRIINGILVSGDLKGSDVGCKTNGIVHRMNKLYPIETVMRWISETNCFLEWFIDHCGFTLGYSDILTLNVEDMKNKATSRMKQTQEIVDSLYEVYSGEVLEAKIVSEISELSGDFSKIALDSIKPNNPMRIMCDSGAKGSEANITQISGMLGQQYLAGKLPAKTQTQGCRALNYFPAKSRSIESQGFIRNSFMDGLTPSQMIFHAKASREGIIDTAGKTPKVGHMQRNLVKSLEDNRCCVDGTVRGANGQIIMMNYPDAFDIPQLISTSCEGRKPFNSFIDIEMCIDKINEHFRLIDQN